MEDIREIAAEGIIVDSEDSLVDPSDLHRIEDILDLNFHLVNKNVITESGNKLGKVENFAIDSVSYRIEKIYARPTITKTLSSSDYIISRRQLAGVNQREVIVKDGEQIHRADIKTPSGLVVEFQNSRVGGSTLFLPRQQALAKYSDLLM